jgi:hypothetical protein
MALSMESRIDSLARRDRVLAVTFTVLMWITLVFVFMASREVAPSTGVTIVLLVSFLILGAFNTASIVGMIRAYAANKDMIYREDIRNLDRGKAAAAQEAGEPRAS